MKTYLKLTIHDNDFVGYFHIMTKAIKQMFDHYHFYPKTEEDLEAIRPAIANLWNAFYMLSNMKSGDYRMSAIGMFQECLKMEIVEDKDIPTWANSEEMYVPLFYGNDDGFLV